MEAAPDTTASWYDTQQAQPYYPQEISAAPAPAPPQPAAPPHQPAPYSYDAQAPPYYGHYPNPSHPPPPQPYDIYGGYPPSAAYHDPYPGSSYHAPMYPAERYPAERYPGERYPGEGYPGEGYPGERYPGEDHDYYARGPVRHYGMRPPYGRRPHGPMRWKMVTPRNYTPMKRKKGMNVRRPPRVNYCEVCQIQCNSLDVLTNHLTGKRHQRNVEKAKKAKQPFSKSTPLETKEELDVEDEPEIEPEADPLEQAEAELPKEMETEVLSTEYNEDLESKKQKLIDGGAPPESIKVCTICEIACNSAVVFGQHIAGNKHAAMVKKLMEQKKEAEE